MNVLRPHMRRALHGDTVTNETRIAYPDGVTRDVEVTYIPQRDRDTIVGCFAFVRDITELKRRRRELEESHELLQSLIDSMPEMVSVKRKNRRYIFVNKTFESWFQVSREAAYGCTLHDIMPEEFSRDVDEIESRVFDGRVSVNLEQDFTGPDGVTKPLSSILFPVLDASGDTIALGLISRDETERKIEEEEERGRLINAVENLAEGLDVFDAEDRFVVCNDQYRSLADPTGSRLLVRATYGEILRNSTRDTTIPEAGDDPNAWHDARMRRHHDPHGVIMARRGDRDLAIKEACLSDGGWVVSLQDVTEQTHARNNCARRRRWRPSGN